jgi:hypothetical protein
LTELKGGVAVPGYANGLGSMASPMRGWPFEQFLDPPHLTGDPSPSHC